MRSVVVDKIASVALAADLGQEIRVSDEIPCEEGVLDRGRSAEQQVALQHDRAHERPDGRGEEGRRRRRRARPSQGAVRLLRPSADRAQARRHRAAAESRRRDRHLRLDQPVARRAVQLQGARLRARFPVPRAARRRARARLERAAEPRRAARDARRAGRRDRGHVHELGQDRGRVRDREPFQAQRPRRRRVQVDRRRAAPRHPRDGRLGRAPRRDVLGLRHLRDDLEERARRSRAAC